MEDAEFSHGVLGRQTDDVPVSRERPYSSTARVLFTLYSLSCVVLAFTAIVGGPSLGEIEDWSAERSGLESEAVLFSL